MNTAKLTLEFDATLLFCDSAFLLQRARRQAFILENGLLHVRRMQVRLSTPRGCQLIQIQSRSD